MPKRILKAIGGLKPWKPKRSLPSYREPTPETARKFSREQEAELALTQSVFTRGTARFLIAVFLVTIASVPLLQLGVEMRRARDGGRLPVFDVLHVLPSAEEISAVRTPRDVWNLLPHAAELKTAEKSLETESIVSQRLLPTVQTWLTGRLGAANEQIYLGRDGWLFYRPDVDYVTGAPFLAAHRLKQRAHAVVTQPDPVQAIVQFRNQLAARGIDLVVIPAPTKPTVQPERLSKRATAGAALQNPSFDEFRTRLARAGVRMFDPAPLLAQRKATGPEHDLYLETDTHWRPETMEFVAQQLAAFLNLPPQSATPPLQTLEQQISGEGDIARMLKLPADQQLYPRQSVTVHQVNAGCGLWRPTADADVLLLGDSFANIFSLEALGWGEAAGFAEHLSLALSGRPLDCILRNSDGAFATREMLATDLAHGRDRLVGKQLVIWEFAARELAVGNWKLIELKLGTPAPSHFFTPPAGADVEVTGTVAAASSAPRPGTVPYKDHVIAVHLVDIEIPGKARSETQEALVYLASMQENVWTHAARLRTGDQVRVKLRAWSDVAAQYEQINRSELDDPQLQLEEPAWGQLVD